MKKTLITLLALAGIAAGEVTKDFITNVMPDSYDSETDFYTAESGWKSLGWGSIEGNIPNDFSVMGITSSTYRTHYFFNQSATAETSYGLISFENNVLTLTGRSGVSQDAWYANVITVGELLHGGDLANLTGISVTLTATGTENGGMWGLYHVDSSDEKVTAISTVASNSLAGVNEPKSIALNETQLAGLAAEDKLVVMIRESSAGKTTNISGLAYTTTMTVPEPATATLSLLALAGLAVRRRRH